MRIFEGLTYITSEDKEFRVDSIVYDGDPQEIELVYTHEVISTGISPSHLVKPVTITIDDLKFQFVEGSVSTAKDEYLTGMSVIFSNKLGEFIRIHQSIHMTQIKEADFSKNPCRFIVQTHIGTLRDLNVTRMLDMVNAYLIGDRGIDNLIFEIQNQQYQLQKLMDKLETLNVKKGLKNSPLYLGDPLQSYQQTE